MDIIALCRRQTNRKDTHYALAVRLCASGAVEVMLPDRDEWIPYTQAAVAVGQIYAHARKDKFIKGNTRIGQTGRDGRCHNSIKLNGAQLAQFAERALTQPHTRPTLALIEADLWRNGRGQYAIWPQLRNDNLCRLRDVLHFGDLASSTSCYKRSDPALSNLLGVVRLRKGEETPQYITYRSAWHEEQRARDIKRLSGFWDASVPDLPHYFSVGRLADTQKGQDEPAVQGLYMMDKHSGGGDARSDRHGANTAFKHPQFVEMVPFFVREDMQNDEGKKSLCRAAHFLRSSPAWTMGNLVEPYPMHLGDCLIADQLCILDIEKSD